ncbi:MAG: OprD family outer membrane porin, partial [Thiogranum sp.]
GWDYGASHVTQMKRRFSDEFVSMSEAAGFSDTDEPMTLAGFSYNFSDDVNIGAINLYSWDYFNTLYAEANAVWSFRQGQALRLGGQFTHQKDVGDAIGGDFDTFVYSGKVSGSWRNAIITLAFSSTDDDARIRSPYGGYPGYLSLMLSDFNRAGEDAWLAGASYDFAPIGVPGLSGFANYARGYTPDSGSTASSDQSEFDITVDYRFQSHAVKGLWLRARAAFLDQDEDVAGGFDVRDYRVILNYTLPLL